MRLDKFLWCVRVFKTRALAADACKGGKVDIGGKSAKPSKILEGGEWVTIRKNQTEIILEVKTFPKQRVGAEFLDAFIIDHTPTPTSAHHSTHQLVNQTPSLKVKHYRDKDKKIDKRARKQAMEIRTGTA